MAESRHGRYVRAVQEKADLHARALLAENERLRAHAAVLEASHADMERRLAAATKQAEMTDALRSLATRLEAEKVALQRKFAEAHGELTAYRRERSQLEQRLALAEDENRRARENYEDTAQQTSQLANLYVAGYRLHESLEREVILEAIREIIVNLVGSEEFGLFEFNASRSALALTDWLGIEPSAVANGSPASERINRTATSGEVYVADLPARQRQAGPIACIPLRAQGSVRGVIALFQLLSHKPAFEPIDHEMFDLLATQAGAALYCSQLSAAVAHKSE